ILRMLIEKTNLRKQFTITH
ncbi:hypothetical protein AZ008_002386, partial [Klebsiella pneumoniae]